MEKEAEYLGFNNYSHNYNVEMSPEDKRRMVYGEYNQGDGLIQRKLNSPIRNSAKKRPQYY